jgi:hypothetical protein
MSIRWSHTEVKLLAKTFLEVRCQDMLSPVTTIMEEAQKLCLPEDRRRPFPLATLGWEVQNEIKTTLLRFGQQMSAKSISIATPSPTPITDQETVTPTPTVTADETLVEIPPPVPFVIEFRIPKVEKPDLNKILENVPTAVLYGYALQRLMAHGFGNEHPQPIVPTLPSIKTEVVQVEALAEQEPIAPTIVKADSVEDPPPPADGIRRVLVLGLLPTAQKIAQYKATNLSRLDITWADINTRNIPPAVVDNVILMRGVVTRFQEEQIRKRFATQDRIYHCEVGLDELMKKLADLNSLP